MPFFAVRISLSMVVFALIGCEANPSVTLQKGRGDGSGRNGDRQSEFSIDGKLTTEIESADLKGFREDLANLPEGEQITLAELREQAEDFLFSEGEPGEAWQEKLEPGKYRLSFLRVRESLPMQDNTLCEVVATFPQLFSELEPRGTSKSKDRIRQKRGREDRGMDIEDQTPGAHSTETYGNKDQQLKLRISRPSKFGLPSPVAGETPLLFSPKTQYLQLANTNSSEVDASTDCAERVFFGLMSLPQHLRLAKRPTFAPSTERVLNLAYAGNKGGELLPLAGTISPVLRDTDPFAIFDFAWVLAALEKGEIRADDPERRRWVRTEESSDRELGVRILRRTSRVFVIDVLSRRTQSNGFQQLSLIYQQVQGDQKRKNPAGKTGATNRRPRQSLTAEDAPENQ